MAKLKICLDAGHVGKYNRSPVNKAYYESDVMWKLHMLQKKYLEQYGFEVILSRDNQYENKGLYERGASSEDCDLFVSDHSNACDTESVDRVTIYHLANDTTSEADDISKKIAEALAPVISNTMNVKQEYKVLAKKASSDRNGDGILNDNYYGVLNGAHCVGTSGLLIEHSFHTNTRSTNWLLDEANLDKLAKAEADVIAEYFGIAKEEVAPELYCVQVGAFSKKVNAERLLAKVEAAGFKGYITMK